MVQAVSKLISIIFFKYDHTFYTVHHDILEYNQNIKSTKLNELSYNKFYEPNKKVT